ncbi:hypothetical protein BC567DRAFT_211171 [Phyllosticta citribraziliensis]
MTQSRLLLPSEDLLRPTSIASPSHPNSANWIRMPPACRSLDTETLTMNFDHTHKFVHRANSLMSTFARHNITVRELRYAVISLDMLAFDTFGQVLIRDTYERELNYVNDMRKRIRAHEFIQTHAFLQHASTTMSILADSNISVGELMDTVAPLEILALDAHIEIHKRLKNIQYMINMIHRQSLTPNLVVKI